MTNSIELYFKCDILGITFNLKTAIDDNVCISQKEKELVIFLSNMIGEKCELISKEEYEKINEELEWTRWNMVKRLLKDRRNSWKSADLIQTTGW